LLDRPRCHADIELSAWLGLGVHGPAAQEAAIACLSNRDRRLLEDRAVWLTHRYRLPRPELPRDPDRLMALLRHGGRMVPGRRRPGGKRSRPTFVPALWAPRVARGRPRNEAGRELVVWLGIAYFEATGRYPPRSACHSKPGPFVRFVRGCLDRLDARHVDAVEVVNRVGRLRQDHPS
jgi:hypothetical protein